MPLGVYRNKLDFEILETGNEFTLVFIDSSQYIQPPENPVLQILVPGYSIPFSVNIIANQVNTLNSNIIGFGNIFAPSLTALPDGVWDFTYAVCPYEFIFTEKKILRTTILNQKIAHVYNELDLTCCSDKTSEYILDQLSYAEILVRGGKAIVNSDPIKAMNYYNTATNIVQKLLHKFCKHCNRWDVPHAEKDH